MATKIFEGEILQGEAWDWFVQPNLIGKRKRFALLNDQDVRILRKSIERNNEKEF